jgi:hypothetical protein|tara:strand:- start:9 stop:512 length:504 start_codon:yes stop_codon:yes gene_type:complete
MPSAKKQAKQQAKQEKKAENLMTKNKLCILEKSIQIGFMIMELEKMKELVVDNLNEETNDGELVKKGKAMNNLASFIKAEEVMQENFLKYIKVTDEDMKRIDLQKIRFNHINIMIKHTDCDKKIKYMMDTIDKYNVDIVKYLTPITKARGDEIVAEDLTLNGTYQEF